MSKGFYWKLAISNLKKNRRIYLPFLLSCVGVSMMFYILNALIPGVSADEMFGGGTVQFSLQLGVFVIGLFAVLFLFYTNSFIMKRRKKELGLYNILGMEKRHIAGIIVRETFLTALATIVLGLGFGILFSKLTFLGLGKILQTEIPVAFVIPGSAIAATAGLFLFIFLLTLLYNLLQIKLSNPIELLHGGEVGEKEPRARWFLAVLGAVLLGAGYFLSVTISDPITALALFFVAVILVILGTYLLFITGITAMLKLMKKNKGFYYKASRFTSISGMLYRMKQNAAGLASICIMFTALLVTVSTTFSLYFSTDSMVKSQCPRDILIYASNASPEARDAITQAVSEELKKSGLDSKNVMENKFLNSAVMVRDNTISFDFPENSSDIPTFCTGYALEDFSGLSAQSETLSENEVLLYDPRGAFAGRDTVVFGAREFSVKRTDTDLSTGDSLVSVYNTLHFVFPDKQTLLEVYSAARGSENVKEPNFYYGFDIEGTPADILTLYTAIDDNLQRTWSEAPAEAYQFDMQRISNSVDEKSNLLSLYGGLFFVGMFLGLLFLLGTALIIYYKQVSEGYEDARRFGIMQKVGMSRAEVKKAIRSQILTVFFLPLLTAVIHLCFAFPMLQQILNVLTFGNMSLVLIFTVACVLVFALAYGVIYAITARTYYKIVEAGSTN